MVRNREGSRGLATALGILVCAGEGTGTACSWPRGLLSSLYPCARRAHAAQQRRVEVPGAPPAPAGRLAHREICAYPSSTSCAQACTFAASLSLLHFAIKHVLCVEIDKCSEEPQKLTHNTQKGTCFCKFPIRKSQLCLWSLLLSNCLSSGNSFRTCTGNKPL